MQTARVKADDGSHLRDVRKLCLLNENDRLKNGRTTVLGAFL